jgi:hypothetical protein
VVGRSEPFRTPGRAEMMMAYRVKLLGLLGLLLGACTALPPDKTEALGPVFNEDVKQGYVALASSTWDVGDWDFFISTARPPRPRSATRSGPTGSRAA